MNTISPHANSVFSAESLWIDQTVWAWIRNVYTGVKMDRVDELIREKLRIFAFFMSLNETDRITECDQLNEIHHKMQK